MTEQLSSEDRNEEAHGHWEFAIIRLAAFVEAGCTDKKKLLSLVHEERLAYAHWQRVAVEVTA